MAMKKNRGKTELRDWVDEQYRKTPGLKERVDALVEEMSIEQGLIALREERGLSQRALADLVGVTQPVIARIESGKARNLAAALGARVKILLEKNDAGGRAKPTKRKLARTA